MFRGHDTVFEPVGVHVSLDDLDEPVTITVAPRARGIWIQAFSKSVLLSIDGTTPAAGDAFEVTPEMGAVSFPLAGGTEIIIVESAASAVAVYQNIRPVLD